MSRGEASNEKPAVAALRDGPVLRLRLQQPEKRNAISHAMMAVLIDAIENAPDDEGIRVIALCGEGEHFCGGADWVAINAPGADRSERPRVGSIARRLPRLAHRLIPAMLKVQIPIVCSVRGWAAGIGCHLALASDFTIAANTARFWEPFAKRAFTPDSGGTWLLPRLVGVARAKEMLMLAREISAPQAAAWGMIHRAVPDEDLERETEVLVAELAEAATASVGITKSTIQRSLELDLEHALEGEGYALELSSRSQDFKEGLAAFKEKRKPHFTGK